MGQRGWRVPRIVIRQLLPVSGASFQRACCSIHTENLQTAVVEAPKHLQVCTDFKVTWETLARIRKEFDAGSLHDFGMETSHWSIGRQTHKAEVVVEIRAAQQ